MKDDPRTSVLGRSAEDRMPHPVQARRKLSCRLDQLLPRLQELPQQLPLLQQQDVFVLQSWLQQQPWLLQLPLLKQQLTLQGLPWLQQLHFCVFVASAAALASTAALASAAALAAEAVLYTAAAKTAAAAFVLAAAWPSVAARLQQLSWHQQLPAAVLDLVDAEKLTAPLSDSDHDYEDCSTVVPCAPAASQVHRCCRDANGWWSLELIAWNYMEALGRVKTTEGCVVVPS